MLENVYKPMQKAKEQQSLFGFLISNCRKLNYNMCGICDGFNQCISKDEAPIN